MAIIDARKKAEINGKVSGKRVDEELIPKSMSQEANGSDIDVSDKNKNSQIVQEASELGINTSGEIKGSKVAKETSGSALKAKGPLLEGELVDEDDYEDEDEGLVLLNDSRNIDVTKREVAKLMRIADAAQARVDRKSRKSVDLPDYIDVQVESLLQGMRRNQNVKKMFIKDYIIALICKDLIERGIFESVKARR